MTKRKRIVEFKSYEAKKSDERGYIRLTPSLLGSDAYRDVSSSAKVIYIHMRMVAKGHDTVFYSQNMAKRAFGFAKGTYTKAIRELCYVGLTEQIPSSCFAANHLKFSSEWKNYISDKRDIMTGDY